MGNGISSFFESGDDYQKRCGTPQQQAREEAHNRQKQYAEYERERNEAQLRCSENVRKDLWQGVSGTRDHEPAPRWGAPTRLTETWKTDDCNQGPWKTPRDFPGNSGCSPRFQLKPPSDFKWGNQ